MSEGEHKGIEDGFFDRAAEWEGTPLPDDYVDPELAGLTQPPNVLQPILILLVAAAALFIGAQYLPDARYAFSSSTPLWLGEAELLPDSAVDGQLQLPTHRHAHLTGVTERYLAAGSQGYAKLVGVPIYLQTDAEVLAQQRSVETFSDFLGDGNERHVVQQPGRLIAADALPRRQRSVFTWYSNAFGEVYCGIPATASVIRHQQQLREAGALALTRELGRAPTDEELTDRVGPTCVRAWLYQEGRSPADHRGYVAALVGVLGILIGALWMLVRWARAWREASGA